MFRAILIEKDKPARLTDVEDSQLPDGAVDVRIAYSTLNYKDALAITGRAPVVRTFPMIPGIDLAGTVEKSTDPSVKPGDQVLVNGWQIGEVYWGGLAQRARLRAEWLVPIPPPFSARDAMAIGTAGFTAMLAVMAIERNGLAPGATVLVTGANGGVGSFSVALLARLGYRVLASTGRPEEAEYLTQLGAAEILDRLSAPAKPLAKERWDAAIDNVGSHTLANAVAGTRWSGAVASCGNAGGLDYPGSVAPFILRGVSVLGIDSVMRPAPQRLEAWRRLAELVEPAWLAAIARDLALGDVIATAPELLAGKIRGRVVVDTNT
ncbi:MAG TPA: MDR family oxidoreductase [Kofleriaceae bacterium]|jgi:acrylyl-CoA reductase (NADPH)